MSKDAQRSRLPRTDIIIMFDQQGHCDSDNGIGL